MARAGNARCRGCKERGWLMRCATPKEMPIAAFGHPASARQVSGPGPVRALGLLRGIDMENDPRDLMPVCAFGLGVEQAQIRHEVLLVIAGEHAAAGSGVGDRRVYRRRLHLLAPNRSMSSLHNDK